MVVLYCTLLSAVVSADEWHIEVVDESCDNISVTSLALDALDQAHISYGEYSTGSYSALKYAWLNGSSWNISTIESSSSGNELAGYTSIALDSGDNPRISYEDGNNEELNYASWNGSSWDIAVVDAGDSYVAVSSSLCLDSANSPTIAYSYGWLTWANLMYARYVSGWLISTVDATDGMGWWVSMALNSDDKPNISYHDSNNRDLMYAILGPEFWTITTVDVSGEVGSNNSIAVDSNDRPHISYSGVIGSEPALKYAFYNGSSWVTLVVDNNGICGMALTSIALDSNDNPHISYYNATTESLRYAHYNGSAWEISTVDTGDGAGRCSSIALDSNDQPHISYKKGDLNSVDLMYAYYGPVGIEEGEGGSVEYTLGNVIPNPSAGSANISFTLPVSCDVDLDIFDITGRKVAVLAEGVFSSGIHETEVSGLTSGIYFCTLRSGDFVDTKTLVVIE